MLFIVVFILTILFLCIFDSGSHGNHDSHSRSESGWGGSCNGDCANCPPHYGYRYGRYYYGHDHHHGCEFGGNRGGGSMD